MVAIGNGWFHGIVPALASPEDSLTHSAHYIAGELLIGGALILVGVFLSFQLRLEPRGLSRSVGWLIVSFLGVLGLSQVVGALGTHLEEQQIGPPRPFQFLVVVTALGAVGAGVWLIPRLRSRLLDQHSGPGTGALSRKELEDRLWLAESIIDNLPAMIFMKEAKDLRFVRFNRAGEQLLGVDRAQLINKNDYDLFNAEQADFFVRKDRETLASSRSVQIEEEAIDTRRLGRRFLATSKVAIRDEKGEPLYLLGVSHDISDEKEARDTLRALHAELSTRVEQRAAEVLTVNAELKRRVRELTEAESRFHLVVESCPAAMIMVDETGRVVLCNQESERLFGYSRGDLEGKSVEDLLPDRFRGSHGQLRKGFFHNPLKRPMGQGRDLYALRSDGTEVPVEIGLNPIATDGGHIVLGVIVDISDRKIAEEQFQKYAAELERSNRDLDQFAYVASHDLKAPLRAVDNLAKWLEEDLQSVLNEDSRGQLGLMRSRVQRMDALLTSLLSYARIGRTKLKDEEIDTQVLVNDAWELLAPPDTFHLAIDSKLPIIRSPRAPLELVLRNLMGNAIKHHDRGAGTISVSASETGAGYRFTVRDDGPGIPEQHRGHVFEMFQTLKPQDDVEGGGMGLALVKKTIEVYGGQIQIASPEGAMDSRGTDISFTWPKHIHTFHPSPVLPANGVQRSGGPGSGAQGNGADAY